MKLVDMHTHKLSSRSDEWIVSNVDISQLRATNVSLNAGSFYSLGIHPWHANQTDDNDFVLLEKLSQNQNVVMIGECGLDKLCDAPFDAQLKLFEKQVELSEQLKKPLIIHCVKSFNELFELYKHLNPSQRWIIHGFRQKPQLAQQALSLGLSLSYGKHFNVASVQITPLERLFIETDESDYPLIEAYQAVAQVKNCTVEQLSAGYELLK